MTECIYRITDGQQDKTDNVKCFYNVYKGDIFEDPSSPSTSKVVDNPKYVKKCFKWAHEMLDQYGLTDSVELVYNDYDTNFEDVRSSILAVTKYINEKDDINPNGDKLVTTVGMQTHDNLEGKYLVKDHKATIDAIKAAGLNVQVTEMDLALRTATKEEQLKDLITSIQQVKDSLVNILDEYEEAGEVDKADTLTEALDALEDAYDVVNDVLLDD